MSRGGAAAGSRGAWAEDAARDFLAAKGLGTLSRNYRCRHGEIDLVMCEGATLVFAEVRYRGENAWVSAAESVDHGKQRRLLASAEHYLQRHREHSGRACRFDVVSVGGAPSAPRVDWIRDAFQA